MSNKSCLSSCSAQTLRNPMRFVALVNGFLFLIAGIALAVHFIPYEYPSQRDDPNFCERTFFPMPIVSLAISLVQFGYYFWSLRSACKKTDSAITDPLSTRLDRCIPFVVCTFLSGLAMALVFGLGLDRDSCGSRSGLIPFLVLMPMGCCYALSSLFYLIRVPKVGCIPTHGGRYIFGIPPVAMLTVWWWPLLLICTKFSPSESEQMPQDSPLAASARHYPDNSSFSESLASQGQYVVNSNNPKV